MKIQALIPLLKVAFTNNRKVLLVSEPGQAKTEVVKQVTKELGYDILILHPVVSDPVDFKGFPFINKNEEADFVPFAALKQMIDAKKPLVVFFDDIGTANCACQAAVMQIIQERKINGKIISSEVRFVAATNRRKDNAGVGNLITPLLNRFDAIINVEATASDWVVWALANNMPLELIQFIRFRPDLISTFKAEKDIKAHASLRSLEALGKWINQGIKPQSFNANKADDLKTDVFEIWQGCVGEAFAVEFFGFYKLFATLSGLPEQVFNNPDKARIPTEPSEVFALLGVLSKRVTDVNINNLFKYLNRIPKEFQMVVVSNIISSKPKLQDTKAYIDWQIKNQEMI